jgi:hypothetical protein
MQQFGPDYNFRCMPLPQDKSPSLYMTAQDRPLCTAKRQIQAEPCKAQKEQLT